MPFWSFLLFRYPTTDNTSNIWRPISFKVLSKNVKVNKLYNLMDFFLQLYCKNVFYVDLIAAITSFPVSLYFFQPLDLYHDFKNWMHIITNYFISINFNFFYYNYKLGISRDYFKKYFLISWYWIIE